MTRPEAIGCIVAVCVLFVWFLGEWAYTHWFAILRWDASRRVRRAMRRHVDRNSANPYSSAFRRGFWYGWIVGSLPGLWMVWRIWR